MAVQVLLHPQFPHWITGTVLGFLSIFPLISAPLLFFWSFFSIYSKWIIKTSFSVSPCFCHLSSFPRLFLSFFIVKTTFRKDSENGEKSTQKNFPQLLCLCSNSTSFIHLLLSELDSFMFMCPTGSRKLISFLSCGQLTDEQHWQHLR